MTLFAPPATCPLSAKTLVIATGGTKATVNGNGLALAIVILSIIPLAALTVSVIINVA